MVCLLTPSSLELSFLARHDYISLKVTQLGLGQSLYVLELYVSVHAVARR